MPDEALLQLELPNRAEASSAARKALTALNGSLHLVSEARLRDTQLLITELITNAVRHGGAADRPINLVVQASPQAMRVAVTDPGPGFDPAGLAPPTAERGGGWGLWLVDALAHRWGVDARSPTTVWFEIDRPQRDAPLPGPPH